MSDLSDDYKERFELRWNEDKAFSQQFMSGIKKTLNETVLPKKIKDNVGTEDDLKGHDLTIDTKFQTGVRIRRYSNPETGFCYVDCDDFTEDDKERDTMRDDIYFFGYSHLDESGLHSHIIFDHHDFRKARDNGWLRSTRRKNKEHGLVWFTCYPIWDIIKHCKIYGKYGRIGWKERRRGYTKPVQPPDPSKTNLMDFFKRTGASSGE